MRWSLSSYLDLGTAPEDSEDLGLRKRMLVTVASLGVLGRAALDRLAVPMFHCPVGVEGESTIGPGVYRI